MIQHKAQNSITLALPEAILTKVKHFAQEQNVSINEFLQQAIEYRIQKITGYHQAKHRQIKLMESGLNLGTNGNISLKREDIYAGR